MENIVKNIFTFILCCIFVLCWLRLLEYDARKITDL